MALYVYKVARDFGFAPNPFQGYCTLATCKPGIRKRAKAGDLIVGCGVAGRLPNRAIFAMRVDDRISFDDYWNDPRFARKRPSFISSKSRTFGDNIYHRAGDGSWIQEDSHHSHLGGGFNTDNLTRDTQADAVLYGKAFAYWGENAPLLPPSLRRLRVSRGYQINFPAGTEAEVEGWFESLPAYGVLGMPADLSKI